jgi:hypothetical protein
MLENSHQYQVRKLDMAADSAHDQAIRKKRATARNEACVIGFAYQSDSLFSAESI